MTVKQDHLLKLIESWEKAYLPTSATMVLKQSREAIKELIQEVNMLTALVEEQKQDIEVLKKLAEPRFPGQPKKVKKNEKKAEETA